VFGSLISAVLLAVPPLWHAAREVIDPSTIDPTVRATSFRIRNDSRKNCGCKPVFEPAIEPAIGNHWKSRLPNKISRKIAKLIIERPNNPAATMAAPNTVHTYTSVTAEKAEKPPATIFLTMQRIRSARELRLGLNSRIVCANSRP
jgi:hypothetical protein